MRKIPIIMDCDPGHDDALAMLWALSEPEKLEIKAVTIVAGNQTLEKTTRNALRVQGPTTFRLPWVLTIR